jgi:hypothetical protein
MPLNLRVVFGQKYQIKMDESYAKEKKILRSTDEPWYQELIGKYGAIYSYSDTEVAVAFANTRGGKKKLDVFLAEIGNQGRILQNADDAVVYAVPNELAAECIKAIKGYRTRQLSEEERNRRRENLKKTRLAQIKPGGNGKNTAQNPSHQPQMSPKNVLGLIHH